MVIHTLYFIMLMTTLSYHQGNSLIRGPPDVVAQILATLGGPRFACSPPHSLVFQIGGKFFPVDPRDFVSEVRPGDPDLCSVNVVPTDAPVSGGPGYLYSWNLGDPFLKGWVGFSSLRVIWCGGVCIQCREHNVGGRSSYIPPHLRISLSGWICGLVTKNPSLIGMRGIQSDKRSPPLYGNISFSRRSLRPSEMNIA